MDNWAIPWVSLIAVIELLLRITNIFLTISVTFTHSLTAYLFNLNVFNYKSFYSIKKIRHNLVRTPTLNYAVSEELSFTNILGICSIFDHF